MFTSAATKACRLMGSTASSVYLQPSQHVYLTRMTINLSILFVSQFVVVGKFPCEISACVICAFCIEHMVFVL
jgi:hypothetical protein